MEVAAAGGPGGLSIKVSSNPGPHVELFLVHSVQCAVWLGFRLRQLLTKPFIQVFRSSPNSTRSEARVITALR